MAVDEIIIPKKPEPGQCEQNNPPPSPANLRAVAVSSTQIDLSWDDTSNETNYAIEYSLDGNSFKFIPSGGGPNVTVFSHNFLSPSTTYYYRIRASNAAGFSGYSHVAQATTLGQQNQKPGSFSLSANAYCNTTPPAAPAVMLSWSASSGATSYDVYRNGTLYVSGLTGTSFDNNANVTADQFYSYYIVARNSSGSTQSNTISITVPSNVCSGSPLSITTTSLPSGTVGVSYGTNLSASGGKTPYTWSIISGSLPPSLSLSGALISGTPTTAGTYNFTIQVKDSSSPQQTASKALSIVINPPATYSISGRVTLNGSGLSGVTITLTGTGSTSTTTISDGSYTFTGAQNGSYTITPSKSGYTFSPSSIPVTVNNANITGQDFTATQTTAGYLSVSPSDRFDSSGIQGGPFSPSSKTYTLSNTGGSSINWTASKGQSWVSLSATSGTLSPGGSTTVTVSINSNANSLSPSNYVDTVSFTNTTNGNGNTTRTVNLTVTYSTPTITIGPTSLNLMTIGLTHHLFFSMLRRSRNKGLHNAPKTANSIFCNGTACYPVPLLHLLLMMS